VHHEKLDEDLVVGVIGVEIVILQVQHAPDLEIVGLIAGVLDHGLSDVRPLACFG